MTTTRSDLTRPPDLSHERHTGPLRTQRPVYVDLLPPCNDACPAGEDIQGWLALAQAGRFEEAWQHLVRDNPLPAVSGRVCYHPCESSCNRARLDSTVSIHAVERFLGDRARAAGWRVRPLKPPSGKRVLVIGAGPSGLAAAHHLALLGHEVEVHEAGPIAGGMMIFGIPAYRLPRDVLQQEVKRIAELGVRFVLNHKVQDVVTQMREGGFAAVFLAIGAQLSKKTEIPASDAGKVLDALAFLRSVSQGAPPKLGRRVAIYGGGNTAMDAARVARRLGHEPLIIYRRDRSHMPAQPFEADEAIDEGVKIHWLRTIKSLEAGAFTVEIMTVDAQGRAQPTGQFETLEADSIILALGQDVDTRFLQAVPGLTFNPDGTLSVDQDLQTGHPGIFAGGDMVPSTRTVTVAIGHGKRAARHIDAYLRGEPEARPPRHPVVPFEKLHVWLYTDATHRPQQHLDAASRTQDFAEVVGGLTEPDARFEAKRCLSCGNCYECDGCLAACPEDAVQKLGPGKRYRFDYDRCTGCASCFEQCPCHAIELVSEPTPKGGLP